VHGARAQRLFVPGSRRVEHKIRPTLLQAFDLPASMDAPTPARGISDVFLRQISPRPQSPSLGDDRRRPSVSDPFMRQISPVARPQSPTMSDSDKHTDIKANDYSAWQAVLEQACRETLKELARNAAEPEASHGAQSIECIVRNVSERVLHEAVVCPLMHAERTLREEAPPPKMLEDIHATPWVLWRESRRKRADPLATSSQGSEDDFDVKAKPTPAGSFQAKEEARQGEAESSTPSTASGSASATVVGARAQGEGRLSRQVSSHSDTDSVLDTMREERPRIRRASKQLRRCETDPGEALCDLALTERPKSWDEDSFRPPIRSPLSRLPTRDGTLVAFTEGQEDAPNVVREGLTMDWAASTQLLMQWQTRPRSCLIVAKKNDSIVLATVQDMAAWLSSQGILVILEPQLLKDHPQLRKRLHAARTFSPSDRLEKSIDLVITVGGDGTLTWAVSLFKRAMPPVLAFAAGSLGFLTPFPLEQWVRTLTNLLDLHCVRTPQRLVCRMRLRVTVWKRGVDKKFKEVQCLNEILVHRGHSASLVKLDVGVDGEKVTLVQGDGLILATPTGSTAYSLAAGGSMVHPSVPGILLTPVSPHSLSFRPALLPDSAEITVAVPLTARCGAFVSVDGKDLCPLQMGDYLEVSMSPHPVPTVCCKTETEDWFCSVQDGLQWNGRVEQKSK